MTELRFRYQTIEFGNSDIHVRTLKDNQQYSDPDNIASDLGISSANWPLFGIIWTSGEILANLMLEFDFAGKRILEAGCGIGLASLVLNSRMANITATDYHPEVENFLDQNTKLNNDKKIPFIRTDWNDSSTELGKFDVIIGSDLLYEQEHAELLANFINQHANPNCFIIIIDPGRSHHARFSKKMINLGFSHSQRKPDNLEQLTKPVTGTNRFQILQYQR